MRIENFVFDLDRTLLNDERIISNFSMEFLKNLQDLHKKIIFNTARGYGETIDIIQTFMPDYLICSGGSLILNNKREIIFHNSINKSISNKLIKYFKKYNIDFIIQTFDKGYSTTEGLIVTDYIKVNNDFIINEDAYKIDIYFEYKENIYKNLKRFCKIYKLQLTPYSIKGCYRINNLGDTKFSGLFNLINILNSSLEKTMSFGDDVNDVEMLLKSKVGVLVSNNKAKYKGNQLLYCDSNNNDGPIKFIKEYLKL